MLIVADASVIAPALADDGPAGKQVRVWLSELATEIHVVQSFTELEVMSALRNTRPAGQARGVQS